MQLTNVVLLFVPNDVSGYYKCCNFCGHAFAGAPGARAYIRHLSDHAYYGQGMLPGEEWKLEQWVYYQTEQEREFLAAEGPP